MSNIVITYIAYLIITICLTVWVAGKLFRNGRVFLIDIFHGNKDLADSVNNLLAVGFYLVNFGYAIYTMGITNNINDLREIIENLSLKIGLIIIILGGMHFLNLFVFFSLRKKAVVLKANDVQGEA
ncbi:MAG: hypothetical protein WKF88_01440 [Ferruginibacter sp.]